MKIVVNDVGIAIILTGGFCLAAILISAFVDFIYKHKQTRESGYECGFDNEQEILFYDSKQTLISYFLVFETSALLILICSIYLISNFISVYKWCFLLFLLSMFLCMTYHKKNISLFEPKGQKQCGE